MTKKITHFLMAGLLVCLCLGANAQVDVSSKAYPFELKDSLGRLVRLSDFKDKALVMDFWFTGCVGCVQVAQGLHKGVMPTFEGDSNVVFISVSIDINFLTWKKSLRKGLYSSDKQVNLFTMGQGGSHPLFKHYNFSGCPQLLVINREGEVVTSSPKMPVIGNKQQIDDFISLVKEAIR